MKRVKKSWSRMVRTLTTLTTILTMVMFGGIFSEVQAIGDGYLSPSIPNDGNHYKAVDADSSTPSMQPFVISANVRWTVIKVALSIDADPANTPNFRIYQNPAFIATFDNPGDIKDVSVSAATKITNVEWLNDGNTEIFTFRLDHTQHRDGVSSDEEWQIEIKNNDTAPRTFFVGIGHSSNSDETAAINEATTNAEIPYVKIVSALINFGEVQINLPDQQVPVKSFTIQNIGTDTLNITSGVSLPSPSPFSFHQPPLINPLKPMESIDVAIKFGPTVLGDPTTKPQNKVEMSITSNDPTSPSKVTLQGTGVTLDAIMLLDLSGSMNWYPDSTATAPELKARLWNAKQAGLQLYQAYNELTGGKGRLGLYGFPDPDNPPVLPDLIPSSTKPVPIDTVELISGPMTTHLGTQSGGGLKAAGRTPMAKGIKTSQEDMETGDNFYRPTILLLSDGAHNVDSTSPPKDPDGWIPTLSNKKIRMYTVAYGDKDKENIDVDHDQLERLATQTNGQMLAANPTDFDALKKSFRGALREWLGLNENADPKSTITANEQKTHSVCIDDAAYTITFVLDWNKNKDNAISFVLKNPQGQQITLATSGVAFYKDKTYAMYVIKGDLVRGGKGAGWWTLCLTGSSSLNVPLNYSYSVLSQSTVKMTPKFPFQILHTGKDLLLEIELQGVDAKLLQQTNVSIGYNIPAESFGTYISTGEINPDWIVGKVTPEEPIPERVETSVERMRAPDTIMGEPATMVQKKVYALEHFANNPFHNKRSEGTIPLYDDGTHGDKMAGDGVFSADAPKLQYDGLYEFFVQVETAERAKTCVNRQVLVTKYVPVHLTTELIKTKIQWKLAEVTPYFDPTLTKILSEKPPSGFERKSIIFTPQDEFGNYWGPGNANRVKFAVKNAEAISPPQDNLDGSYIQVIQYKKGDVPSVTVSARGVTTSDIPMPEKPFKIPLFIWILLAILILLVIIILIRRRL